MARNARLSYGADSDLDPNIIALINRKIETQVDSLIDDRVQRRQLWGPTFKQEGISNLTLPDTDFTIPSPEYGKRTLVFNGTLSAGHIVRLPPISSAWWIVRNNTAWPLTFLTWPNGIEGPTVEAGKVEIVYTDGIVVWRVTGPTAESQYTGEWRFSTLLTSTVADGFFRMDNGTYASTTFLVFSEETNLSVDASVAFDALGVGDQIYFQDRDDSTKFGKYEITGPITEPTPGQRVIPVAYISGGGPIANNQVCVVRLISVGSGSGSGGGGAPGGTPTQLQFQVDSTTFGGVTGSSVSAANVGLGGTLNIAVAPKSILLDPVSQAFGYMQFDRASPDLTDGDQTGAVVFKGRHGGGTTVQTGYLRSYWSDSFGPTVELGVASGSVRFAVAESATLKAATMISGTKYWQVDEGGLRTSEGAGGAILYQDGAPLYLKALDIGLEHQILKVTDIGGGVLRPRWGVASSAGGVPEGIATELQSRDPSGTVFKRVTGSSVSGGDVGLAGNLTFSGADVTRTITFNRTGADLVDGDVVGQIFFNGQVGGSPANYGFIRSLREDSAGGKAVDIGVDPLQRMVISATLGALILSGSTFIRVQPTGIRLSGGAQGSLFYQDGSPTFFTPLTIGANNTFLRSDSVRPGWVALTMAMISGTVPITQGGTGLAITTPGEPLDGALLIGNGSGFALSTLTAGTNVTINNTAGHITINATAGAASQRLDQILNPLAATNFNMAGWQVRFRYDGAVPDIGAGGGVLIDSTTNAAGGGTLLLVRNTYTDDNAARLFACQIGSGIDFPLAVTHIGAVGMGGAPNPGSPINTTFRLQVFSAAGGNGLYVSGNVRFTGGTNWGVYYLNGTTQNLTTSAAAAGFLKSTGSAPPVFTPISMTDVSGTVPITQGGTGLTTSPIGAGQILIGNGTTYALGTITNGGGISVSYTGGNIQLTATGGSVNDRLDTILAPTANTNLNMGGFQARFRWDGAVPAAGVLIDSTSNSASQGILLHLRNTYTDDNAARLLLCQINSTTDYPLAVTHIGAVGMGGAPNPGSPISNTFRLQVFAPSSGTLNALYASGQVNFVIPGMSDNSLYYRSTGGNLAGIPAAVTAGRVAMSDGSTWAARAITVVGGSVLYTGGVLQLTTPGGGGAPEGVGSEIQSRDPVTPTLFKRVTSSSVSGSDLTFTGNLNVNSALASPTKTIAISSITTDTSIVMTQATTTAGALPPIVLQLDRSRASGAAITNGSGANADLAGELRIRGVVTSGFQRLCGFLGGLDTVDGSFAKVCAGTTNTGPQLYISTAGSVTLFQSSGIRFDLTSAGIAFTGTEGSATTGAIYYRNSSGRISGLDGGTGYLKTAGSGTVAAWDTIDISSADVTGVLTLAKGGTGANLSAPGGNRILYYDNSAAAVTWLSIDSSLSINTSTDTLSAVAATPAGQLRGSKALTNNSMTTLMQILFATSDQLSASGWIDLLFVAKRSSPSADVQTHRRIISFVVSHSRSSVGSYHFKEIALPTTGVASGDTLDKRVTQRVATDSASLGFTALSQQINSTTTIELGAVDLQNSIAFDTFQFKILANSPYSLTSLTVFYNIVFNGDAPVTVV